MDVSMIAWAFASTNQATPALMEEVQWKGLMRGWGSISEGKAHCQIPNCNLPSLHFEEDFLRTTSVMALSSMSRFFPDVGWAMIFQEFAEASSKHLFLVDGCPDI